MLYQNFSLKLLFLGLNMEFECKKCDKIKGIMLFKSAVIKDLISGFLQIFYNLQQDLGSFNFEIRKILFFY